MIYMLDTNTLTYIVKNVRPVVERYNALRRQHHIMATCQVPYFEILRGYLHKGAVVQEDHFRQNVLPTLTWYSLAAEYWAQTRSAGKQLSDMDLLLAAVTFRLNATLASNDVDFDVLPISRVHWRETT